jgi:tRNA(His) guanylyltransferase
LRQQGQSVRQATAALEGLSVAAKNELLFQAGINFNDLPAWQKRGVGLYWEEYDKIGQNPLTGQTVTAQRRRVKIEQNLPLKHDYERFLRGLIEDALSN